MSVNIEDKLVEFINTKIDESKPDKGIERLKIGASLLASFATLVASILAFAASFEAASVKSALDRRQLLLDENSRIGAIYPKLGETCSGLPLDEKPLWEEYRACLLGEEHRYDKDAPFSSNTDFKKRVACLSKNSIKYCK